MTAAAILILTAGVVAVMAWIVVAFLQFLAHASIFSGLSLALIDIAQFVPGDVGIYMMAALMAAMVLSSIAAWRGWRAGLARVGMA